MPNTLLHISPEQSAFIQQALANVARNDGTQARVDVLSRMARLFPAAASIPPVPFPGPVPAPTGRLPHAPLHELPFSATYLPPEWTLFSAQPDAAEYAYYVQGHDQAVQTALDETGYPLKGDDEKAARRSVGPTACLVRRTDGATGTIRTALALGGGVSELGQYYHPSCTSIGPPFEIAHTQTELDLAFTHETHRIPSYGSNSLVTIRANLRVPKPNVILKASAGPLGPVAAFARMTLSVFTASPLQSAGAYVPGTTCTLFSGAIASGEPDASEENSADVHMPESLAVSTIMRDGKAFAGNPYLLVMLRVDLTVVRTLVAKEHGSVPPTDGFASIDYLERGDAVQVSAIAPDPFPTNPPSAPIRRDGVGNGAIKVTSIRCDLHPCAS